MISDSDACAQRQLNMLAQGLLANRLAEAAAEKAAAEKAAAEKAKNVDKERFDCAHLHIPPLGYILFFYATVNSWPFL